MTLIEVKSLKLDGHSVPVPVGLSELLLNSWVMERKPSTALQGYNRQVINRDGQLITRLSKK